MLLFFFTQLTIVGLRGILSLVTAGFHGIHYMYTYQVQCKKHNDKRTIYSNKNNYNDNNNNGDNNDDNDTTTNNNNDNNNKNDN